MASWIESFVESGENLETPEIFRRWAAITTLGAILEQRVFVLTNGPLFPNLYVMLVGPPGVGKSRAISSAASLVRKLDGFHVGPISVTGASLIDALAEAKRMIYVPGDGLREEPRHFNSLLIMPDDLQALLHKYDNELVGNLTIFYDTIPYIQTRRVESRRVEINSPQLSILAGTTNSHLLGLLPPGAWDQGFMSRTIMVHSPDRPLNDDLFALTPKAQTEDLLHDLRCIFSLSGQLTVSDPFRAALNDWRKRDGDPKPNHPRLKYYCARRTVHLLKLAVISCCDRGDSLNLERSDYDRALQWLEGAELTMPDVFTGVASVDGVVMQEVVHILGREEVPETKLIRLLADRVSANMIGKIIQVMLDAKMIYVSKSATIKTGSKAEIVRYFKAS